MTVMVQFQRNLVMILKGHDAGRKVTLELVASQYSCESCRTRECVVMG